MTIYGVMWHRNDEPECCELCRGWQGTRVFKSATAASLWIAKNDLPGIQCEIVTLGSVCISAGDVAPNQTPECNAKGGA